MRSISNFQQSSNNAILGGDTYSLISFTMTVTIDSTKTDSSETFKVEGSLNYLHKLYF